MPTLEEAGIHGIAVPSQQLLAVREGTPPAVISRIAAAVDLALADGAVRTRLTELGLAIEPASGERLLAMVRDSDAEYARLSAVASR